MREDYIIWNTITERPKEKLDIVYHYTSVVELVNNGFKLGENEIFVCFTDLPIIWQGRIAEAIGISWS